MVITFMSIVDFVLRVAALGLIASLLATGVNHLLDRYDDFE